MLSTIASAREAATPTTVVLMRGSRRQMRSDQPTAPPKDTRRGYTATDSTKKAVTAGLDALAEVTGGGLVRRADDARKAAVYEMNAAVAKQVLKSIKGR